MCGFSLVLIANDRDELLAKINDRLASRLRGAEQIRSHRYTSDELVDILSERAKRELTPDAIAEKEVETIDNDASGDVRVAIATLRIAAKQTERENAEQITSNRVEAAAPNARREIRQKSLESLTNHQRAVYKIIKEYGEISPDDLYSGVSHAYGGS